MDPISKKFVGERESFAKREQVPVTQFRKGERKDDVAAGYRKKFRKPEGVVAWVKRRGRCRSSAPNGGGMKPQAQRTRGWCVRQRWVNQFYIYCVDRDSAPSF